MRHFIFNSSLIFRIWVREIDREGRGIDAEFATLALSCSLSLDEYL